MLFCLPAIYCWKCPDFEKRIELGPNLDGSDQSKVGWDMDWAEGQEKNLAVILRVILSCNPTLLIDLRSLHAIIADFHWQMKKQRMILWISQLHTFWIEQLGIFIVSWIGENLDLRSILDRTNFWIGPILDRGRIHLKIS